MINQMRIFPRPEKLANAYQIAQLNGLNMPQLTAIYNGAEDMAHICSQRAEQIRNQLKYINFNPEINS